MRKVWLIARKYLIESAREPGLLALILAMPLFFMVINAVAYAAPRLTTYPILVVAGDARAEPLIATLAAQRYADGRPTFTVGYTQDRQSDEALKSGAAAALVVFAPGDSGQLSVTVRGDATAMRFILASALLDRTLGPAIDAARGKPVVARLAPVPLQALAPQNDFDAYAPGMMVFGVLLIIPQAAMLLARERRTGTLRRLRLTPLRPWQLLSGATLSQMVMGAAQVILMFAAAMVLGFHNRGSLLLAVGIGILLSFGAIGLGMIVACFVEDDNQALNVGATFTMLQVFISGSFFAMPALTLFTIGGYEIGAFDFIPASHGLLALQQVLIGGAGLSEVAFRIAAMTVLSVVYFAAGVWVFGRAQMRAKAGG